MKFEKSRKEFYEDKIHEVAPIMAEMLDNGYQVEVCRSRSGIKIYSVSKKHYALKGGNADD